MNKTRRLDDDGYKDLKDASLYQNVTFVISIFGINFHNFKISASEKNHSMQKRMGDNLWLSKKTISLTSPRTLYFLKED